MIQPPVTALEEAQRGSSWLEDLVAFLIACASWEHLSWPVYLHTHTHTHTHPNVCCLFWSILSGLIRSDDSVCLNVFISSDFVIFPHPCDFFFFSLKVSVDCIPLLYLMSKSCSVPWQLPSSPPSPKSPSPIHPTFCIPSGGVCSIHPPPRHFPK